MPPTTEPLTLPRHPRFVDLVGRSFTGEQLEALAASKSIIRLDFKDCAIGDREVRAICTLPKLQSLWLAGTQVTDAALPEIARLPKLDWLILDRTDVTGLGFGAFSKHATLRTLWMSDTPIGDEAMPLLADIPRLSILRIKNTRVTPSGLLSLAVHPTVKVSADGQFQDSVMAEFDLAQRRHSNRTPQSVQWSEDDLNAAVGALRAFITAMNDWELKVARSATPQGVTQDWMSTECRDIFAKHCTPKERKYGRPNALSYGTPPDYSGIEILDTEWLTARKLFIYTKERMGFKSQHRFLLVKRRERWLVDHKEILLDGWQRDYL